MAATPYQRDLSDAHVEKLTAAVDKLDRYLDPVIAVRAGDAEYWTPNGHHRTASVRGLGGKSITALVVPETEAAQGDAAGIGPHEGESVAVVFEGEGAGDAFEAELLLDRALVSKLGDVLGAGVLGRRRPGGGALRRGRSAPAAAKA